MHWDDPSYDPSSSNLGAWKDEADQLDDPASNGSADKDEAGEFYDATDGGLSDQAEYVEYSEQGDGKYTEWKYDECAEPYDRTHRHYSGSHPDDYDQSISHENDLPNVGDGEDHHYEDHYEASDSDLEDLLPNFAIPDVTEFNRTWAARHPASPTSPSATLPSAPTAQTRPPIEVGGGGRSLSHSEIWSDTVITSAFNSALYQYCELHELPWSGEKVESALWKDAPLHHSLLAGQIRVDTLQILAQQKSQSNSLDKNARLGRETNGKATNQGSDKKAANGERRGKPIVTLVPSAHLEGNTAWKKAVKTVQTTPNSIGLPNEAEQKKEKEEGNVGEEGQNMLNAYWTAGYYAGLAAAASASTSDRGAKEVDEELL